MYSFYNEVSLKILKFSPLEVLEKEKQRKKYLMNITASETSPSYSEQSTLPLFLVPGISSPVLVSTHQQ